MNNFSIYIIIFCIILLIEIFSGPSVKFTSNSKGKQFATSGSLACEQALCTRRLLLALHLYSLCIEVTLDSQSAARNLNMNKEIT